MQNIRLFPRRLSVGRAELHAKMLPSVGKAGGHQPAGHAPGAHQRLRRERRLRRGAQLFQLPFRVGEGGGDEQAFLCARHGDVQQAHLLAQILALKAFGDGHAGERGVADALLGVDNARPETELRVDEHGLLPLGEVEAPRGIAEKDHREFEALGLVDGQDLHRRDVAARGGLLPALGQRAEPEHEAVQAAVAAALKALGQLHEGHQVFAPLPPVVHRGAQGEQVQRLEHGPDGLGGAEIGGGLAEKRQAREKIAGLVHPLRRGLESGEEIAVPVGGADGAELVRGEGEGRRAQHRDQRDVLVGVVHDREHTDSGGDLGGREVAAALRLADGDPGLQKRAAVDPADGVGRAQQDGDIAVLDGPHARPGRDGRAGGHKLADAPRDEGGLAGGLVGGVLLRQTQQQERGLRDGALIIVRAPDQRGVGVVVHIAERARHAQGEDRVGRVQDLAAGAEVLAQQDAARKRGIGLGKGAVFFVEDAGVGQTEAVDRLLDVADEKEPAPVVGHGAEDRVLHGADVLILVDHDLVVALREAAGQRGRRAVFIQQEPGRQMLEIGVIQKRARALVARVQRVEAQRQAQQRAHGGSGGGNIPQQRVRRSGEDRREALHAVERGLAAAFETLGQLRIGRIAQRRQARRGEGQSLKGFVPAEGEAARELAQHGGKLGKVVGVGGADLLTGVHLPDQRLKLGGVEVREGFGPIQQLAAPGGLARVGKRGVQQRGLFLRPALGPGVALHAAVEVEHQLRQRAVVAALARGVGQQAEVGVLVDPVVGLLERAVERV